MTTLSGFVASVVVHSSAAAFAHFGVTVAPLELQRPAPAPVEHVVARIHPAPQKALARRTCRTHPRVERA